MKTNINSTKNRTIRTKFLNRRRIYPFNKGLRIYGGGWGVYNTPFHTLEINTSTYDMKLTLSQIVRLTFLVWH